MSLGLFDISGVLGTRRSSERFIGSVGSLGGDGDKLLTLDGSQGDKQTYSEEKGIPDRWDRMNRSPETWSRMERSSTYKIIAIAKVGSSYRFVLQNRLTGRSSIIKACI